jgi:hypothetical protein
MLFANSSKVDLKGEWINSNILFCLFNKVSDSDCNPNLENLGIHHQGRNSNGKPRPPKYMLDYDTIGKFLVDKLAFPSNAISSKKISETGGIYKVNPEEAPELD